MRRDDPRQNIIRETLERLIPGATPAFLTVEVRETSPTGGRVNTWNGRPDAVAERIATALFGHPTDGPAAVSPLEQADAAKRRRDLPGELGALIDGERALTSAPWYPPRPGDIVHLHYEATDRQAASGETYEVKDAGDGLVDVTCIAHHHADGSGCGMAGAYAQTASDRPVDEMWFEAGPHRLTIVRDGVVVHNGPASAARKPGGMLVQQALTIGHALQYLERGDTRSALARLRTGMPLPTCKIPPFMPDHKPCARPDRHDGPCSDDPAYTEPPHACPALPERLFTVAAIDAERACVQLDGIYEDFGGAAMVAEQVAHSTGAQTPQTATCEDGHTRLCIPADGVPAVAVVPLPLRPDPRTEDEWAAEGTATALGPEDYADDYDDADRY